MSLPITFDTHSFHLYMQDALLTTLKSTLNTNLSYFTCKMSCQPNEQSVFSFPRVGDISKFLKYRRRHLQGLQQCHQLLQGLQHCHHVLQDPQLLPLSTHASGLTWTGAVVKPLPLLLPFQSSSVSELVPCPALPNPARLFSSDFIK